MITGLLQSEKYRPQQEKILNAFSAHVAIIDADGMVLETNQSWKNSAGNDCSPFNNRQIGDNYFDYCKHRIAKNDDYALRELLGLYAVLEGKKETFENTYPFTSADGVQSWFSLKVIPVDDQRNSLFIVHRDVTDQVRQRKQLRESRERYQMQFNHSLDGILITSGDGHIIEGNPAASTILGYPQDALKELKREDVVDVTDSAYQEALQERKTTGSYRAEFSMKRADGTQIIVEGNSNLFRTETGETQAILNFRDITDRKKTEAELLDEKRFVDSTVNSIPGIFFVMDTEGKLVRWNENLVKLLGYSEAKLAGSKVFDLIHEEDIDKAREAIDHILATGNGNVEIRTYAYDGEMFYYHYQGKSLEMNGQTYIVGTGIDLTDQKQMEQENNQKQAMMDQLFENSPIGIAMVDKDQQILRTNPSFSYIFGYEKEESLGQNIDELLIPEEIRPRTEELNKQALQGDTFQVDTIRKARDGTDVPVLVGIVPVEVDDELIALYGMYADITERKRLEEQIKSLLKTEKEHRREAESEKIKLEEMFSSAPSAICVLEGPEHCFTFANKSYEKLVGKNNLTGKTVAEILPEITDQGYVDLLDRVYQSGEIYSAAEQPILLKKNDDDTLDEVIISFVYKPLTDGNDNVYGVFVEAIDVTEQVTNRRELSRSLQEKEVLIQEIHHRVKNNLALISSMVQLQLDEAPSGYETSSLYATKSRIHTIAKIQEQIYQTGDLNQIRFDIFLHNLSKYINGLHGPQAAPANIQLNLKPVTLNVNQAVPFGLLINEIIAKIGRHYSANGSHNMNIALNETDSAVTMNLSYSDANLRTPVSFNEVSSLNDTLIKTLSKQLGATLLCEQCGVHEQNVALSFVKTDHKGSSSRMNQVNCCN